MMGENISRRDMIATTIGGAAAGVVAGSVLGEGLAAGATRPRASQIPRIGTVNRNLGSHAEVLVASAAGARNVLTVPVHGFPSGWRLRPGDRVPWRAQWCAR